MERPGTPAHAPNDQHNLTTGLTPDDDATLWNVAWQSRWALLIGCFFAAAVTYVALMYVTPVYRAKTHVLLGSNASTVIDMPSSVQQRPVNAAQSESAVIVMKSNDVLRAVVEELGLEKRAEYNPSLREKGAVDRAKNWARGIAASVRSTADQPDPDLSSPLRVNDPLAGTVRGLRAKVSTKVLGESFVIEVSAQSSNPRLAAIISDTIAEKYLEKQLENSARAGDVAIDWLEDRVSELRGDVAAAELKVAEFRTSLLISGGQMAQDLEPQLEELNTQLARLSIESSDSRARRDEISNLLKSQTM